MPETTSTKPTTVFATPMVMTTMLKAESFKPAFTIQPTILPMLQTQQLNLAALRMLTVDSNIKNAPVVTAAPTGSGRAVSGVDGHQYFVPQAQLAQRSKASPVKNIFFERTEGKVILRAWFDLVRAPGIAAAAKPLPVDGYAVSLVDGRGTRIAFTRCDELPAAEVVDGRVAQLLCETEVDPNQVVSIMQEDRAARFDIQATAHFGIQKAAPKPTPKPKPKPSKPKLTKRQRRDARLGRRLRGPSRSGVATALSNNPGLLASLSTSVIPSLLLNTAASKPVVTQTRSRLSIAPSTGTGASAHFPTSVAENRMIYAQVTSGFGSEPWSTWARGPEGHFTDSPIPDQFYILPDEYRLAFNPDTGLPTMSVLLVPPSTAAAISPDAPTESASFSRDYRIRCQFGVVPYVDPARRERLRNDIAKHTGIAYPDLLVGGVSSAMFNLSNEHAGLGASLVGGSDAAVEVDAHGFSLVLDCNNQFYALLSSLLVGGGVGGNVVLDLLDSDDDAQQTTVPLRLQLNRPALDFLATEMVVEPMADNSTEASEAPAVPAVPKLRISNPSTYDVTITNVMATLLVVDDTLPSPIDAVVATASPASLTIAGTSGGAPTTAEISLTPIDITKPTLYGGIGVGLGGVRVAIDPRVVLDRVHDLGGTAEMSTEVEVQSFQLAHPDMLPESHTDVFGIEVQLKRNAADPITIFLTRDQASMTAQVAFTLSDALAGASPEQPTFSWRRRNMAAAGTGEFSEWEDITGRQLFVSPTGLS